VLQALILAVWAFVLYANTIPNGYNQDDHLVINGNKQVQGGIGAIPDILTSYYTYTEEGEPNSYRPLVKVVYALEYSLLGDNVHAFHFTNVLWYVLACLLALRLVSTLLAPAILAGKLPAWLPLVGLLLFAAHPIHTEVVASLKNRDELLGFVFGILAVQGTLNYTRTGQVLPLVWASVALLLGLLSKLTVLPYWPLAVVTAYWFAPTNWKRLVIAVIGLGLSIGLYFAYVQTYLPDYSREHFFFIENPIKSLSGGTRYATGFESLLWNLRMLFLPHPLAMFYGYNTLPFVGWDALTPWLSVVLHLGIAGVALWGLKKKHLLGWCAAAYILFISMYSNLLAAVPGIMADRFLFAASLPFCLALAYGLLRLLPASLQQAPLTQLPNALRSQPVLWGVMGLLAVGGLRTLSRNQDWKDPLTLFTRDVRVMPNSAILHFLVARELGTGTDTMQNPDSVRTRVQQVVHHFREMIRIDPNFSIPYEQAGMLYLQVLGRYDSAVVMLRQGLRLDSAKLETALLLAQAYIATDKPDSAHHIYNRYAQLYSGNAQPLYRQALLYMAQEDTARAEQLLQKAIDAEPQFLPAHELYTNLLFSQQRFDDALKANDNFKKHHPDHYLPYANQGTYYLVVKRDTLEAAAWYDLSLNRKFNITLAQNLMEYFKAKGDTERAGAYEVVIKAQIGEYKAMGIDTPEELEAYEKSGKMGPQ